MLFQLLFLHFITSVSMTSVTLHNITDTLSPENEKYAAALEVAAASFREAEALFRDEAFIEKRGWKNEEETDAGDIIYGKQTPRGKIVTVSTVLKGQVDYVMEETWTGITGLPDWNPNIKFARKIANLSDHADIVTYGNNRILVVDGRDFVSVRIYRPIPEGGYLMTSKSVEIDEYPKVDGKVRADLILAVGRFRPDPSAPAELTLCDVVMLVDLKGLIPKIVADKVIPKIMMMDTEQNKKHFETLAKNSLPKE